MAASAVPMMPDQDDADRTLLIFDQLSSERAAHFASGDTEAEWVFRLSDFIIGWITTQHPHITADEADEQVALELEGKDPLARLSELESFVVMTQLETWAPGQAILPEVPRS